MLNGKPFLSFFQKKNKYKTVEASQQRKKKRKQTLRTKAPTFIDCVIESRPRLPMAARGYESIIFIENLSLHLIV